MKKIIFMLISLLSFVNGDTFEFQTEQQVSLETKSMNYADSTLTSIPKNNNIFLSKLEYNNKTNFNYNRLLISTEFSLINNNKDIKHPKNCSLIKEQHQYDYIIQKLYAELLIYDSDVDISVAYGIVPFTGGNFKQYSNQDEITGNGLFTVINISLVGTWVKVNTDNFSFITGVGNWNSDNFYHDYSSNKNLSGKGLFTSTNYNINNITNKQVFQFDFYNENMYKDDIKIMSNKIFGIGYSFESYKYSTVLYTILSKNFSHFKHAPFLTKVDKLKGGSVLLGVKRYCDVFSQEVDIGYEYYKTYGNFYSPNPGSNYNNDYGFVCGGSILSHKVYTDIIIDKNLIINVNYLQKTFNSYVYKKETSIQTGITYKF